VYSLQVIFECGYRVAKPYLCLPLNHKVCAWSLLFLAAAVVFLRCVARNSSGMLWSWSALVPRILPGDDEGWKDTGESWELKEGKWNTQSALSCHSSVMCGSRAYLCFMVVRLHLVHNLPLSSQFLHLYKIVLLSNRGTRVVVQQFLSQT